MQIPVLRTDRLIMRELRLEDFEAYAALHGNDSVMEYVSPDKKGLSRMDSFARLCTAIGHWELRGYGRWAVVEKDSGTFVGVVGLYYPEGWPDLEVTWAVSPAHQGKGYAFEAAKAAMDYAFNVLQRGHVISLIHADNKPSLRVAEKLGETLEGQFERKGQPLLIYGRNNPKGL
jgi:RimJ/RimL family protein N-acetyltransferase